LSAPQRRRLDLAQFIGQATAKLPFAARLVTWSALLNAGNRLQKLLRALPISWRIMLVAALNVGLAVVLLYPTWSGTRALDTTWNDLWEARRLERLLGKLDRDVGRLQVLALRQLSRPDARTMEQVEALSSAVREDVRAAIAPARLRGSDAPALLRASEAFLANFEALREIGPGSDTEETAIRAQREERFVSNIVDGADALFVTVEQLLARLQAAEAETEQDYGRALASTRRDLAVAVPLFLVLVGLAGLAVSWSIIRPLSELCTSMLDIADGGLDRRPPGTQQPDEIGDMARAVEVFRRNALAKLEVDEALRRAKERAEEALAELRSTQMSLVEAEKLAALGGLVAGVAHEINNPVGIGLTVASSMAGRCRTFASHLDRNELRRSELTEFVKAVESASSLIVANLERAGDLVSSFKQVAVDRSDHERRRFDLKETLDKIAASLRPGCKAAGLSLEVGDCAGVAMESYPGLLGQVITNLCLNSVKHGYPDGHAGKLAIEVTLSRDQVLITVTDDGCGMAEEVKRRAFEPFFTTRRGSGGTGLGLHIVFNIVTHQLGGRIRLTSGPGAGTRFDIEIPIKAPHREDGDWRPSFTAASIAGA
jgi:signal transduction histidine kinase